MIANDVRPTRKQYGIGQLNFFPTVNVYRASEVQNCSSCLLCHSISRERYRTSSIFSLQLMSHLGSNIEGKKCWVLSPSGRRVRSQLVVCQRTGYFYQGILFLLTLSPMSSLILRDSGWHIWHICLRGECHLWRVWLIGLHCGTCDLGCAATSYKSLLPLHTLPATYMEILRLCPF